MFIDDAGKNKYWDEEMCKLLNFNIDTHSKLPDVIIYDRAKDWVFLFEAFVTHGPIDETRLLQLYQMFEHINHKLIFVTAFATFNDFKRNADKLAFETEVWIAELPTHMIHYNGDKLLGPRNLDVTKATD